MRGTPGVAYYSFRASMHLLIGVPCGGHQLGHYRNLRGKYGPPLRGMGGVFMLSGSHASPSGDPKRGVQGAVRHSFRAGAHLRLEVSCGGHPLRHTFHRNGGGYHVGHALDSQRGVEGSQLLRQSWLTVLVGVPRCAWRRPTPLEQLSPTARAWRADFGLGGSPRKRPKAAS